MPTASSPNGATSARWFSLQPDADQWRQRAAGTPRHWLTPGSTSVGIGYRPNPLCESHAASGGPCSRGRIGRLPFGHTGEHRPLRSKSGALWDPSDAPTEPGREVPSSPVDVPGELLTSPQPGRRLREWVGPRLLSALDAEPPGHGGRHALVAKFVAVQPVLGEQAGVLDDPGRMRHARGVAACASTAAPVPDRLSCTASLILPPVNAATAIQHYGGGPSMGRSVAGSESPTGVPYRRSCRRAEAAVGGDGNNGGAKGTRPPDLLLAKVAPSSNRCVCNALILPHRVA